MSKIHWFERYSLPEMALIKSDTISGSLLKSLLVAGSRWLNCHVDHLNALNVFPVPDGDTGTNMTLTLKAALAGLSSGIEDHAGQLARQAAAGALMGARGNSGVILSQILAGFANEIDHKQRLSIPEFAAALQTASDCAYQAVLHPVEGTILTVMREVARAGREMASSAAHNEIFLSDLLEIAQATLQQTPEFLPVLRQAHVVDSGGQGLVYFLEGMVRYLKGLPVDFATVGVEDVSTVLATPTIPALDQPELEGRLPIYGYDVQFLIKGQNLNIETIRRAIDQMGECTLVVGNEDRLKVHVHVTDPGQPLTYGVTQGELLDIVVENMDEQARNRSQTFPAHSTSTTQTAVVAMVSGPGLARIVESLGAQVIMNQNHQASPSTQAWLEAIDQVGPTQVILLPNNKNIILTAQQAGLLSKKEVAVLPTRNMPQGISALLAFNPEIDLGSNLSQMAEAMAIVRTVEITRSVRTTTIQDISVNDGDTIALLDDTLIAGGNSPNQVILQALNRLEADNFEVLTIYVGAAVSGETADHLAQAIAARHPDLEIDVLDGGQLHYSFIISLE